MFFTSKIDVLNTKPDVDFSVTHPVPGKKKHLDYVPTKDDPLYVGQPLPSALLEENIEYGSSSKAFIPITTVRELFMLQFMAHITDKPNWSKKVFDTKIIRKWRSETAGNARWVLGGRGTLTPSMFDYCIAELQYVAKYVYPQRADGALVVYNGNIVRSDEAIPKSLKRALQLGVKPLENVPKNEKDWHPGSKKMVLDLVHPSLYPLVYGKSRVLKVGEKAVGLEDCVSRCGEGKVIKVVRDPPRANAKRGAEPYSLKFQWLPCEVDISGNGARITSYVNNLHPQKHEDLYGVIEKVIDAAIPLWELSLAPLYDQDFEYFQRVPCETVEYEEGDNDEEEEENGDLRNVLGALGIYGPEDSFAENVEGESEDEGKDKNKDRDSSDGLEEDEWVDASIYEDEDDYDDGYGDDTLPLEEDIDEDDEVDEVDGDAPPKVIQPDPEPFDAKNLKQPKSINFKELYGKRGRPLQVIVKLANIELNPKRPKYRGGAWHVEGKQNEHICATALYYYSSTNIKSSSLAFRQFVDADSVSEQPYEPNHHEFLREIFGCENGTAGIQEVGHVETKEGRLLTFPNILQHQVQPFELIDPTRKGHRKVLALFLVDPNVRVISTANVPCQQLEWWREATLDGSDSDSSSDSNRKPRHTSVRSTLRETFKKGLSKLPMELKDHIFGQVDGFPITLLDAKAIRLRLMKERKKFAKDHYDQVHSANAFSLCEH